MHKKSFKSRLYITNCAFSIFMYKFKDFHSKYNSNQSGNTYQRKQEYKKYIHKYPSFKDSLKSNYNCSLTPR